MRKGCSYTYCLDECSGLEMELSGVDNFKYGYYFNGPLSDLYTLPTTGPGCARIKEGGRGIRPPPAGRPGISAES